MPETQKQTYWFDIYFRAKFEKAPDGGVPDYFFDRLYESGCDNALISAKNDGSIFCATFAFEADSSAAAIISAIQSLSAGLDEFEITSLEVIDEPIQPKASE